MNIRKLTPNILKRIINEEKIKLELKKRKSKKLKNKIKQQRLTK